MIPLQSGFGTNPAGRSSGFADSIIEKEGFQIGSPPLMKANRHCVIGLSKKTLSRDLPNDGPAPVFAGFSFLAL
jgi:hypothetical protein